MTVCLWILTRERERKKDSLKREYMAKGIQKKEKQNKQHTEDRID